MRRLILLLLLAAGASACGLTFRRSYSLVDLNAEVARRFPMERRRSVLFVRLANPVVTLPGGDRIGLSLDLEAGAAVTAWRGRAAVEGTLEYRATDGDSTSTIRW